MADWRKELQALLAEQVQTNQDADASLAQRRAEARSFVEKVAVPALLDIAEQFRQPGLGRRVEVKKDTNSADAPYARIEIEIQNVDRVSGRQSGGHRYEFIYGLKLKVEPRRVVLTKETTDYDLENHSFQPVKEAPIGDAMGETALADITQEQVIRDFLSDYRAQLKAMRR